MVTPKSTLFTLEAQGTDGRFVVFLRRGHGSAPGLELSVCVPDIAVSGASARDL